MWKIVLAAGESLNGCSRKMSMVFGNQKTVFGSRWSLLLSRAAGE
jgi:hypothetical protein